MMAAISKMINVTSCSASHTSCRKVFGFFGGIKFCPKICFLFSRSGAVPGRPVDRVKRWVWACTPKLLQVGRGQRRGSKTGYSTMREPNDHLRPRATSVACSDML